MKSNLKMSKNEKTTVLALIFFKIYLYLTVYMNLSKYIKYN